MSDDRSALDAAWGTIPQTRESGADLGSFTRTRIERIISIVVGIGSAALGAQGLLAALAPWEGVSALYIPLTVVTFVSLGLMIIGCFVGRATRALIAAFAIIYPLALMLWPFATASAAYSTAEPWIFFLINIATAAAMLVFRTSMQVIWTVAIPLLFGAVRILEVGLDNTRWIDISLEVSFALILGGIIFILGWVFRAVAAGVDETRNRAVESYARAAAANAIEQERLSVAALMHDSVLAALISAERADSARERTLAVSMAREALTRLANTERDAGVGTEDPIAVTELADGLSAAAAEVGAPVVLQRYIDDDALLVPGRVARAIVLAVTQALTNSVKHADAAGLALTLDSSGPPTSVLVRVSDTGPGFRPEEVPVDRLGISASIIARIAAVGGRAQVESGDGGTTVTVEWEEPL